MKKFFSAILLMAAMAFSVSTFVSCNDLIEDVEKVTDQAGTNAEAIKTLQGQVATLESGLASANAAIDAAKKAADAAAEAAATAKKEAIEEALTQAKALLEAAQKANADEMAKINEAVKELAGKVEAVAGRVTTLEGALESVKLQIAALEEFKKNAEAKHAEIEAAIEALDTLKAELEAMIEEFEGSIDATVKEMVNAEIAKITELVNGIDPKLNNLKSLASALASQIQSITFVPTTAGMNITQLGQVKLTGWNEAAKKNVVQTNKDVKYVLATYEVMPKGALEALEASDLKFVSVKTKAVAEAKRFDVKIVEKDIESGRMIVLGLIDKKVSSAIYNDLAKYTLALTVADENVVDDVDAGTYVSSAYVEVSAEGNSFEIANNLGWKQGDKFGSYTNEVKVKFDTEIEKSVEPLFGVNKDNLMVNFNGTYLTFDQVKEFFGIENMNVTHDTDLKTAATSLVDFTSAGFVYDLKEDKKTPGDSSIHMVSYAGFDATASMRKVTTEDFEAKDAIKDRLDVVIGNIKIEGAAAKTTIAGTPTNLTASSAYIITYDDAPIKISSPGEVDWHYTYGSEWTSIQGTGTASEFLARMKELNVIEGTPDITKVEDATDELTPAGYLVMKGKAYHMDGTPYQKVAGTDYEGYVYIKLMGKSIVRLAGSPSGVNGLVFADEDLYWEFEGAAYDGNGKQYIVEFDTASEKFVTKAIPQYSDLIKEDVIIEGWAGQDMVANVDPIATAIAEHGIFELEDAEKAGFYTAFAADANAAVTVVSLEKLVSGAYVPVTPATLASNFNVAFGAYVPAVTTPTAKPEDETSTLTIDAAQGVKYGEVYQYTFTVNVFGINYTYEYTITVGKPNLGTILEYDGVNTDSKSVVLKLEEGATDAEYTIPEIALSKYIKHSDLLKKVLDGGKVGNVIVPASEFDLVYSFDGNKMYKPTVATPTAADIITGSYQAYLANKTAYEADQALVQATPGTAATVDPVYMPLATANPTTGAVAWNEPTTAGEPKTVYNKTLRDMDTFTFTVSVVSAVTDAYGVKEVVATLPLEFKLEEMLEVKVGKAKDGTSEVTANPEVEIDLDALTGVTYSANVVDGLIVNNKVNKNNALVNNATATKVTKIKYVVDANGEYYAPNTPSGTIPSAWYTVDANFKVIDSGYNAAMKRYKRTTTTSYVVNANHATLANWNTTLGDNNGLELNVDRLNIKVNGSNLVELIDNGGAFDYSAEEKVALTPAGGTAPTYTAPEGALVTYDVATGEVKLINDMIAGVTTLKSDITVVIPVALDHNYNAGHGHSGNVTIVFKEAE